MNTGTIVQVDGPVVDVAFPDALDAPKPAGRTGNLFPRSPKRPPAPKAVAPIGPDAEEAPVEGETWFELEIVGSGGVVGCPAGGV